MTGDARGIVVELNAVIVAVEQEMPQILTVRADEGTGPLSRLPSGSLDPEGDPTLDLGLRRWVREQTGLELGYIEQLYTFGDQARSAAQGQRVLSIAYLALTRQQVAIDERLATWQPWYDFVPWEDWRSGPPRVIIDEIVPTLANWVSGTTSSEIAEQRRERMVINFGLDDAAWDPVRVLDRYELLYEAGAIAEANSGLRHARRVERVPTYGEAMSLDHRRIVATALSRLRGKLTYRPVVFELLPSTFTLLALQRVVEALAGVRLHKPNFRRLVEQAQLVEGTGRVDPTTGGRPAELFTFRREVLRERPAPGVVLPRRTRHRTPASTAQRLSRG